MIRRFYISFGQGHTHDIRGVHFDHDSLCEIQMPDCMEICSEFEEARLKLLAQGAATQLFEQKWAMIYSDKELPRILPMFPRGVLNA